MSYHFSQARAAAFLEDCFSGGARPDGGGESVHTHRAVHGSVNAPVAEATAEQQAELERMRERARQKAETLEDNTRLTRASAEGVI